MKALWQQALALFTRLSRREQRMVSLLLGCFTAAAVYLLVVAPIFDGRAQMERRIESLREDIEKMQRLGNEIASMQARGGSSAKVSDENFSLFSFVDRVTASAVQEGEIESMNPSRRQLKPGLDEMLVELRLSKVPLAAVVSVLRSVEESGNPVYVKQLQLKRRYDDKTRFDVVLVAATMVQA